MARGNGSASPRIEYEKVTVNITLPRELVFICKEYGKRGRIPSFTGVVQRLLETHPDLTSLANSLYNRDNTHEPPA